MHPNTARYKYRQIPLTTAKVDSVMHLSGVVGSVRMIRLLNSSEVNYTKHNRMAIRRPEPGTAALMDNRPHNA